MHYLRTSNEVTTICTPFESVLICGTKLGSICVFDLNENVIQENVELGDEIVKNLELEALKRHYKILEPAFSTDGLVDIVHYFDITKLVSLSSEGSHRVIAIDSVGKLSSWIVIQFSEGDWAGSLADLTLKIGGKIKLAFNHEIDLSQKLNIVYEPETFEIDFDPNDLNSFVFSTSNGLFYSKLFGDYDDISSTKGGAAARNLDTSAIGEMIRVTSISFSDQNYILAGFEEGTIGLYHSDFSGPMTVWHNS